MQFTVRILVIFQLASHKFSELIQFLSQNGIGPIRSIRINQLQVGILSWIWVIRLRLPGGKFFFNFKVLDTVKIVFLLVC